jgi:uncharacterized protein (TIGR01244 family)
MSSKILLAIPLIAVLAQAACSGPQVEPIQPPAEAKAAELLRNGKMPFEGVLVGGQPTAEQFETLAGLGYGTIVNLRQPEEKGNTDSALIESLGMRYVAIPIGSAETLNEQNALELAEILAGAEAPVVVHCASGNRVGALFALKAYYADGETPEEALALGQQAGMTRTASVVKQRLGLE